MACLPSPHAPFPPPAAVLGSSGNPQGNPVGYIPSGRRYSEEECRKLHRGVPLSKIEDRMGRIPTRQEAYEALFGGGNG